MQIIIAKTCYSPKISKLLIVEGFDTEGGRPGIFNINSLVSLKSTSRTCSRKCEIRFHDRLGGRVKIKYFCSESFQDPFSRGTSFSKVVRRKIYSIQSGTATTDYLYTILVINYLSFIVPVFVYTISLSIDGRSIRIRCITHEFALVFSGFSPFLHSIALGNKAPDIWKSIEKEK